MNPRLPAFLGLLAVAISPLLLASVLQAAVPASEASNGFITTVKEGDGTLGLNLKAINAKVVYVDANSNGGFDLATPDETLYLDLNQDRAVSYGDLRLTPYVTYPAGSLVDYPNRDFGRLITDARGWVSQTLSGALYFDADANRVVSPADVRLSGSFQGTKVGPDDGDTGLALTELQDNVPSPMRLAWRDPDGNLRVDPGEPVYVDINGDKQISPGDIMIGSIGFSVDNDPTRKEFDSAMSRLTDQDAALRHRMDAWSGWLLTLAILDLVGLGALAWYTVRHFKRAGQEAATRPPSREERGHMGRPEGG